MAGDHKKKNSGAHLMPTWTHIIITNSQRSQNLICEDMTPEFCKINLWNTSLSQQRFFSIILSWTSVLAKGKTNNDFFYCNSLRSTSSQRTYNLFFLKLHSFFLHGLIFIHSTYIVSVGASRYLTLQCKLLNAILNSTTRIY